MIIDRLWRIEQDWLSYSAEEHETWSLLYSRALDAMPGHAADEHIKGLSLLQLSQDEIPNFTNLTQKMKGLTGWSIIAVPGILSDDLFFSCLAKKEFPVARDIRPREHIDYALEPDLFHDVFGHLPMLTHQVFADYLEAYGKIGMESLNSGGLRNLAALYMNTVEFGLIETNNGLRIYGAGILSSPAECAHALESQSPNRIRFDAARAMTTNALYDDFQQTYFVIETFDQLFNSTPQSCWRKLAGELKGRLDYRSDELAQTDNILHAGTQAYAKAGGRFGNPAILPTSRYTN